MCREMFEIQFFLFQFRVKINSEVGEYPFGRNSSANYFLYITSISILSNLPEE